MLNFGSMPYTIQIDDKVGCKLKIKRSEQTNISLFGRCWRNVAVLALGSTIDKLFHISIEQAAI